MTRGASPYYASPRRIARGPAWSREGPRRMTRGARHSLRYQAQPSHRRGGGTSGLLVSREVQGTPRPHLPYSHGRQTLTGWAGQEESGARLFFEAEPRAQVLPAPPAPIEPSTTAHSTHPPRVFGMGLRHMSPHSQSSVARVGCLCVFHKQAEPKVSYAPQGWPTVVQG